MEPFAVRVARVGIEISVLRYRSQYPKLKSKPKFLMVKFPVGANAL